MDRGLMAGLTWQLLTVGAALVTGVGLGGHRHAVLSRRLAEANRAAATDTLTGLANRAGLERKFKHLVASATRTAHVCLLMLDLDGFKEVNDRLGHAAGDRVLEHVGRQLARYRPGDSPVVVARLGGDEFVIAFLADPSAESDTTMAERAREARDAVSQPLLVGSARIASTVSVGATSTLAMRARLYDLLAEADDAMYRAKRDGAGVSVCIKSVDGQPFAVRRPRVRTRDARISGARRAVL